METNVSTRLMAAGTAREMILRLFQETSPREAHEAISFSSILEALSPEYRKGTVSARLSELVDEGLLERKGRGQYRLVYSADPIPESLRPLTALLTELIPERTLHSTILWDVTPYLAKAEDGVVRAVHVLETAPGTPAGGTARMLLDHWPQGPKPAIREYADRYTMLETIFGGLIAHAPRGSGQVLVAPADRLYAATELHPEGIRIATQERVLADMLWLDDPASGEIIQLYLTSQNAKTDPKRLIAASDERDLLPDLFAVLGRFRERLPEQLRTEYAQALHGTARRFLEDDDT